MFEPPTEIPETVKSYILTLHLTFNKKIRVYCLVSQLKCYFVVVSFSLSICCLFLEPFFIVLLSLFTYNKNKFGTVDLLMLNS